MACYTTFKLIVVSASLYSCWMRNTCTVAIQHPNKRESFKLFLTTITPRKARENGP